ncbi:uncharacterized protein EV420DRAFT_1027785 [Desarmillaria tabescens]|uniref:Zn(2)-C6 fungal-type domain-containing protein n=1 Tax=Armillaria tabescens TaxID=1929756 RepID=A0AA39JL67_ARMTA|nr:uncharacterized protein EV420DRAFT_1027785 [Desarmillaria tabescens]KAK0443364.1 hypothetical protein EV420DRAFT_1027785 [Desarmillaria tabescens]
MSNGNPFNDRSLQNREDFLFDFEPELREEVAEDWFVPHVESPAGSSLPSVNVSWVDGPLVATSGYKWNQSVFWNGSTSIPSSEYHMSDAGSSNGGEVHYMDHSHASFESSPASGQYQSLIPDFTSQRRNSLPSDYRTHRSLYGTGTSSDNERPEVKRLSWQGGYDWLSDAASSSYHSSRRSSFGNLAELPTSSMPMPYPTESQMAAGQYNYSDPNVTQSAPTLQHWLPFNSPASSEVGLPLLNRTVTPELSAQLQSALFLQDNNGSQRNINPSFHPHILNAYSSGTQVSDEHAHFNNSQPKAGGTASHPGSSGASEGSTSPRFVVYVPNDDAEAGPSSSPYRILPQIDSGFHSSISSQLPRNSSRSKLRGEPRPKSVACNYCRTKKNKCVGVSGQRCESCTTLNIECTYSESRRGKYIRKARKKDK